MFLEFSWLLTHTDIQSYIHTSTLPQNEAEPEEDPEAAISPMLSE